MKTDSAPQTKLSKATLGPKRRTRAGRSEVSMKNSETEKQPTRASEKVSQPETQSPPSDDLSFEDISNILQFDFEQYKKLLEGFGEEDTDKKDLFGEVECLEEPNKKDHQQIENDAPWYEQELPHSPEESDRMKQLRKNHLLREINLLKNKANLLDNPAETEGSLDLSKSIQNEMEIGFSSEPLKVFKSLVMIRGFDFPSPYITIKKPNTMVFNESGVNTVVGAARGYYQYKKNSSTEFNFDR